VNHRVSSSPFAVLRTTIVAVIALMAGAVPAFASDNDGDITTTLAGQQTSVTQTTTSVTTYASYRITLTHYTARTEATGPITVKLTTTVDGSPSALVPIVGLSAAVPAGSTSCGTPASGVLTCTTNSLSTPGQSAYFDVTVAAPTSGSQVGLKAETSWYEYGEGTEYAPTVTASIPLDVPDPNKVKSYVPANTALTLFPSSADCVTGTAYVGCAATPTQPWTTTVQIPASSQIIEAEVAQAFNSPDCARAGNLLNCSTSILTIPGSFDHLVITLRRDGSTISSNGAKIANAVVYYDGSPKLPPAGVVYPLQVPNCTDTTYGPLPAPGIPCIKVRTDYPKKTVPPKPPVPPEFPNDWEFVIWALDNGKYNN
jgi:hypothetical protein